MLEKVIESKVVAYAKEKGFLAYKFNSIANRAVPDRIFISPNGTIGFIEFKQKGKLPTKLQSRIMENLMDRGVRVRVIDDIILGKEAIDEWV